MAVVSGVLYVVATPIGNLGDFSPRAAQTLAEVDLVAAEDTRHSRHLFDHFNIKTPLISYHEHNEEKIATELLTRLKNGERIALISDAGTPMISDPGFTLVKQAREQGLRVVPIPGPSAVISALSVSGLPTDRFFFEGFLPAKSAARRRRLEQLLAYPHTLAFYETPHRISDTVQDLVQVLGGQRPAVLARELTKLHETVHAAPLEALPGWLAADANQQRGEFVVLVAGNPAPATLSQEDAWIERLLTALTREMPVKQAVAIAMEVTGRRKNELYRLGVAGREDE